MFCFLSNREAKHRRGGGVGSIQAWRWDGGGYRKGVEGLQGRCVQEREICSRGRRAVELEALQLGLRILPCA